MAIQLLLGATLLVALSPSPSCASNTDSCLPSGIHSTDVVSAEIARQPTKGGVVIVTVAQKLRELKARCRKHKLVDGKGREIRFYQLIGCWGNPPADYQEQLEHQAKELANLRRRYRVIEMTCDTSGDQRMRAGTPVADP